MNERSRTPEHDHGAEPPVGGPAISRRRVEPEPSAAAELDGPLPPFSRSAGSRSETAPAAAEVPADDDVLLLDTPIEPGVSPAEDETVGPGQEADTDEGEPLPEWLSWVGESDTPEDGDVPPPPPPAEPETQPEVGTDSTMDWLDTAPAEVTAAGTSFQAETSAVPAPPPVDEAASAATEPLPAFVAVAERLERIARSLRERRPGELLNGADGAIDPLEALIAGYALGIAEGGQQAGSAPENE